MKNDSREKAYSKYVSAHTSQLYGEFNLGKIKNQFSAWQAIYGKFLPKNKKANILDAGCGNGGFVFWLQEGGYKNAFGVDISAEQVELAEKIGVKNIKQEDVFNYLKDKEDYFDLIFARDLVEHFKKDEVLRLLELFYSSLKKGGKLVIQTPNAEGIFGSRYAFWDITHETVFTRASLNQVFRLSGFDHLKFYPTRPPIHNLKSFVRRILWMVVEVILKFYLLVETGSPKAILTQNIIVEAEKD